MGRKLTILDGYEKPIAKMLGLLAESFASAGDVKAEFPVPISLHNDLKSCSCDISTSFTREDLRHLSDEIVHTTGTGFRLDCGPYQRDLSTNRGMY
jgi:hypothetical protein